MILLMSVSLFTKGKNEGDKNLKVNIIINETVFSVNLTASQLSSDFISILPLTLELNPS
ncbi:MAG: hypothetical protein JW870_19650 [Candidatus Delongbacteria bacterium]|nr:hypothetical protein [Candidatus Delongbacteria bacterium]